MPEHINMRSRLQTKREPNEVVPVDTDESIRSCKHYFGCYAAFATLPLKIAFVKSGHYPSTPFNRILRRDFEDEASRSPYVEYLRTLGAEDFDFFTLEEYQFLFEVNGNNSARTKDQVQADRGKLQSQLERPRSILKEHARVLVKAVGFWELNFEGKHYEWTESLMKAWKAEQSSE
jgi:hypothetical protein